MRPFQLTVGPAILVSIALATSPAQALFHLWDFTEFFSNADGTVQFIELHTTGTSETVATAGQLRSLSTGHVFQFPTNLSGSTLNKSLLVATAGFQSLPGLPTVPPLLTPDYTLPANFFNQAGDTVSLTVNGFGTVDSRAFTSVPTDGVMSLNYPANAPGINSPTNYAGTMGSVDLTPPPMPTGDYNGDQMVDAADYTTWRDTLGQAVATMGDGADGDADGMIDDGDYDFWVLHFGEVLPGAGGGAAASAAVPEPATLGLATLGLLMLVLTASSRRPCAAR
jgi:hypothetical protein